MTIAIFINCNRKLRYDIEWITVTIIVDSFLDEGTNKIGA